MTQQADLALRRANLAENVAGTVCEKCIAYEDEAEAKTTPVPVQFYRDRGDVTPVA